MPKNLTGTLTVRLPVPLERRLARRAKARGTTPSSVVRSLIEQEVGLDDDERQPSALELLGDLVGVMASTRVPAARDSKKALPGLVFNRRG
jgi:predicted DNA-binding protein